MRVDVPELWGHTAHGNAKLPGNRSGARYDVFHK